MALRAPRRPAATDMPDKTKYIVGTSGYSFDDWVGEFYPPQTRKQDMLDEYARHFSAVELNFSYYRMPAAGTLDRIARRVPEGFVFWIKANRKTTHEQDRSVAGEFLESLAPLGDSGKLAGVLLQFPQSFHRTVTNRKYLAATLEDFASAPLAVEFRHRSWDHPSAVEGLSSRHVTLVIPDAPDLEGLYRPAAPILTSAVGYLRLHSRDADKWYAGASERYDYDYSQDELQALLGEWSAVERQAGRIYAFFNNCHRGQAARNAEAFRRLLDQI